MLVSIIMPTYNCGRFIGQSVESVLAQTVTDWELLIVDDCSTDDTRTVLEPYLHNSSIHYYRFSNNKGVAAARNKAIYEAQGKYIAFLDSDDVWMPDKLEKQIAFMEETGARFCCTAYGRISENGEDLGVICKPPKKTGYRKMFYLSDPIGNLTVMYDQEILGKYYAPAVRKRVDYGLWLKMLREVDCCYGLDEVLAIYRIRGNSVSRNKMTLIKYQWHLYHKIEKMGLLKSGIGIICWIFVKGTRIGLRRKTVK